MTNPADLVSLSAVKTWLQITDTTQDAVLASLITSVSRQVLNELSRGPTLGFRTVTETRSGTGTNSLMINFWPVLSVTALGISGGIYTAQTDPPFGTGFFFDQWTGDDTQGRQRLYCYGASFDRYQDNVTMTYTAGYQTVEPWVIPEGSNIAVGGQQVANPPTIQVNRPWYSDQGVTYASTGAAFTLVSGSPAQGQYSVSAGIYTFSSADTDQAIIITYSYTPEDLQEAVIEILAWRFQQRNRIGMVSKGLQGETTTFSQSKWSSANDAALQPFRNVVPL